MADKVLGGWMCEFSFASDRRAELASRGAPDAALNAIEARVPHVEIMWRHRPPTGKEARKRLDAAAAAATKLYEILQNLGPHLHTHLRCERRVLDQSEPGFEILRRLDVDLMDLTFLARHVKAQIRRRPKAKGVEQALAKLVVDGLAEHGVVVDDAGEKGIGCSVVSAVFESMSPPITRQPRQYVEAAMKLARAK